ncbi:hypothetical protein O181_040737 [Austropuccinia psidii MF-1]|uniref:Uncharacterized protein n=1 Tax=Austropuccinia psidii MF-1 TaxID=1389203 RepID=A0A9Q3DFE4_9BASI|nr:hypothetical protein [Austropuccinia psidii MF-1]
MVVEAACNGGGVAEETILGQPTSHCFTARRASVLQGARRTPLTSKQGPIGFYKGTGSHPALGPKSQGSHGVGRQRGRIYRLDPQKMRSFIVPSTVLDFGQIMSRSDLRPYTESSHPLPNEIEPDRWPIDRRKLNPKVQNNRSAWHNPRSVFSKEGFDSDYFRQLMNRLRESQGIQESTVTNPDKSA